MKKVTAENEDIQMWTRLNVNISTKNHGVPLTNSLHESILNIRTFKPSNVKKIIAIVYSADVI